MIRIIIGLIGCAAGLMKFYLITGLAFGFLSGMWLVIIQIHDKFYSHSDMSEYEYDQVMAKLFGRWW